MEITLKDTSLSGTILNEITISVERERSTIKDLITARVTTEVEAYNAKRHDYFKGLVAPTAAEKTLNGYKLKDRKKSIDAEQQVFIALDAFQKNGYFILIDDQQAESLEQEVLINENTAVNFIKLTQLVGG